MMKTTEPLSQVLPEGCPTTGVSIAHTPIYMVGDSVIIKGVHYTILNMDGSMGTIQLQDDHGNITVSGNTDMSPPVISMENSYIWGDNL